jgi:hypothetical protein
MKKGLLVILLVLLPIVSALNLNISVEDKGSIIVSELNNPAVYQFTIDNNGEADNVEIYSLVGVSMFPKGNFDLPTGKKIVDVQVYPTEDMRKTLGLYFVEYQIKGNSPDLYKDKLSFTIVSLDKVLEFSAHNVALGDSEAIIDVKNVKNTNINNLELDFDSEFFYGKEKISLKPFEEKKIIVKIKKDKLVGLFAGSYIFGVKAKTVNGDVDYSSTFKYVEKQAIETNEGTSGFIIRKTIVEKKNNGNVNVDAKIEYTNNIISRLFTSYSVDPVDSRREVFLVKYVWEKEIAPNESYKVEIKTNYTIPFILLLLVVIVAIFAYRSGTTNLNIRKRVSLVKTRGGEFALKVNIHLKANKDVEDVQLVDILPNSSILYEKYGSKPDRVDHGSRRLFWSIKNINAGEERVISYVIYSKLRILGRYQLPSASAVYSHKGVREHAFSNMAYFVSETASTNEE